MALSRLQLSAVERKLVAEAARQQAGKERTAAAIDYDRAFHPKQATLVRSLVLGSARNVCALCGRQSGKSHGAVAAALVVAASVPGVNLIYVASTHATCKKMAFLPGVALNRDLGLGGKPAYGQELAIAFPNGSAVYFLGADSEKTISRLRGVPNLVMVIIDEASVYKPDALAEMIETVRPGLRPRKGKLVVMGTGSMQGRQGTWVDITESPEFEQHYFDYRDNDRVPSHVDVEATIDEDLRAQFPDKTPAEARQTAWFKREYLAEHAVELAEQVYQITDDNLVDEIPEDHEQYATGGDIGVSANDALVCAGWSGEAKHVYIVDQEEASGQDSIACAAMVEDHFAKRRPMFVALDAGGLGTKTIKTVKAIYPEIPVIEAEKPAIGVQVRAFNTLAAHGRLKIRRGSKLALELVGPTWIDGIVGGKIDEHGKHSDLVPSVRYLAVKLIKLLPGLAGDEPPPPTDQEERVAAALRKARGRRFDDVGQSSDLGHDMEPGSPWD